MPITIYIPKIFYYDAYKVIKKKFFLVYIKVDEENITFSKNQGKSCTMTDPDILGYNTSFEYEDPYNYFDIDMDKILLLKKGIMNVLSDIMM